MALRSVLWIIVSVAGASLAGCGLFGGNSYNFRMTVEVDTPNGLKTGSSVYKVTASGGRNPITGGKTSMAELGGEAVMVELPDDKILFALLKTENPLRPDLTDMSMATLDPAYANDRKDSAKRIGRGRGVLSSAEVAPDDYPLLVTFSDMRDPTSVTRVDPADLAASFGPGVRLKRIIVEVTDDDVTSGIDEALQSIGIEKGRGLDRTRVVSASLTLAQQLGYRDFVR